MSNEKTTPYGIGRFLYLMASVATSMIGYNMHHSIGWAIMDFIFTPLTWLYWLITQQITLSIIKETFSFFLNN